MRTVGIIGGLSWQSTYTYYRLLNEGVGRRLGGHHSADLRIWSGDFDPIHEAQKRDDHEWIEATVCSAGEALVAAGSDLLAIASNTTHRYAAAIERRTGVPIVHIVDVTAEEMRRRAVDRVLLLGTGFTMRGPHYRERMAGFEVETMVPDDAGMAEVHRIIFDELVHGKVEAPSRQKLLELIEAAADDGAQGVILGCTELGMILDEDSASIPGFDTTRIHCEAIIDRMLA